MAFCKEFNAKTQAFRARRRADPFLACFALTLLPPSRTTCLFRCL